MLPPNDLTRIVADAEADHAVGHTFRGRGRNFAFAPECQDYFALLNPVGPDFRPDA